MRILLIVTLLAVTLVSALQAQDTGPMLPAAGTSDMRGEFTPEIYVTQNDHGNITWPVKYQDYDVNVWSLSLFDVMGYQGAWQYNIHGLDLTTNNLLLDLDLGYADNWWLQASIAEVTRRIPIFPLQPPGEAFNGGPIGERLIPVTPLLLSEFAVDRNTDTARLSVDALKSEHMDLAIVGDLWSVNAQGNRPLPFRTRQAGPTTINGVPVATPITNRTKYETTEAVDERTADPGIGAELGVGKGVVTYRHSVTKYTNNVSGPLLTEGFGATDPIRESRFENTSTRNNVWKLGVPLTSNLDLTGTWALRNRTHHVKNITLFEYDQTTPGSDVKSKMNNLALNMKYAPSSSLSLVARYHNFDQDQTSPVITSTDEGIATLDNQSISRHDRETGLEATFTGLRSTLLRGSYTDRKAHRDLRAVHQAVGVHVVPTQEEWEHPVTVADTRYKTYRLGATTHLIPSLTLRANWKHETADHPEFHGTPNKTDDLSTGLTWTGPMDILVYADYNKIHERNDQIAAPTFLDLAGLLVLFPDLADLTLAEQQSAYTAFKDAFAGAKFDSKTDVLNVGLFKSISSKFSLDANYLFDKIRSRSFWILGTDAAFPPNIGGEGDTTLGAPERVPYDAKDTAVSAGLTYAFARRWSLRSNVLSGKTDGKTVTSSLFRLADGTTRNWQPIDVRYWRYSVGFAYRWTPGQQVLFEVSRSTWNDKIDGEFDGAQTLFSVAVQSKF